MQIECLLDIGLMRSITDEKSGLVIKGTFSTKSLFRASSVPFFKYGDWDGLPLPQVFGWGRIILQMGFLISVDFLLQAHEALSD
jgi:hypothetical protein